MRETKTYKIKGDPPPADSPRTVTGAQLSSSGAHLSTTGSGIRELFERGASAVAPETKVADTEETARPSFVKARKRG